MVLNVSTERVLTHQIVQPAHCADRETEARRAVTGSRPLDGFMGKPALEAMPSGGPLLLTCDRLVFPAGSGGMKGGPAAELGCHKTELLRSTGSSLSPSLAFQSRQDDQVRWSRSPAYGGRDVRRKWGDLKRPGFPWSLGPEHPYPCTSWGRTLEVPDTLSRALGARLSCGP